MPVANDALSRGLRFLFMPYGGMWRRLRGLSHKLLTPNMSNTFKPSQEWEGKMLLEEVLGKCAESKEGNKESYMAVRRYTTSVMMTSTYGKRIPEWVRTGISSRLRKLSGSDVLCRNATKSVKSTVS